MLACGSVLLLGLLLLSDPKCLRATLLGDTTYKSVSTVSIVFPVSSACCLPSLLTVSTTVPPAFPAFSLLIVSSHLASSLIVLPTLCPPALPSSSPHHCVYRQSECLLQACF